MGRQKIPHRDCGGIRSREPHFWPKNSPPKWAARKRRAEVVLGKNNLGLGGGGFTLQFGENMRKEGAGRKEATVEWGVRDRK